jgi:PTS system nitrogen regulatory IIA component
MLPEQLIRPENVLCNARARGKKHCLEILSELLAQSNPAIANEEIFSRLIERERLGCTSLGRGVAFPHCRVPGATRSSGALIRLSVPVDFDAGDGEPVDLVFGLMVPETVDESHHDDISRITACLQDEALRSRLRAASSSHALYEVIIAGFAQPGTEPGESQFGPFTDVYRRVARNRKAH